MPNNTQALYSTEDHLNIFFSAFYITLDLVDDFEGVDEGIDVLVQGIAVLFNTVDI